MNILYGIGIYMLASSFFMTAIVLVKSVLHHRSGYDQVHANDNSSEENNVLKESLAA